LKKEEIHWKNPKVVFVGTMLMVRLTLTNHILLMYGHVNKIITHTKKAIVLIWLDVTL
jgi:hypothetical protein